MPARTTGKDSNGHRWQAITTVLNIVVGVLLTILGWFFMEMNHTLAELNRSVITLQTSARYNEEQIKAHDAKLDALLEKYYSRNKQ